MSKIRNLAAASKFLENVRSTAAELPTDGQALVWDNVNSIWKPGDVTGGSSFNQDLNTTNSPIFAGLTMTGDVLPNTDNTHSLGAVTNMWKDIYVGPGSLYVNGKQVISDVSDKITISTDLNQHLRLETTGTGNIELDALGTGVIAVQSTLQIQAGNNITSNDGNAINFANQIAVDNLTSRTSNGNLTVSGNGTGYVYVNDDLVVSGNLSISGTTFTIDSETIRLADNIIDLNSNFTTGTPTENAGIRVIRGDETNVQLRWNENTDVWDFTNDGTTYYPIPTTSDIRSSISASGSLNYDSATGVISYTAPTLATVATSGDYADLTNKPTIPADVSDLTDTTNLLDHFSGSYTDLTNKPTLFSGSYADLTNKPTIPANIDDLIDVDTTTAAPTDGQALVWDNANSIWKPGTVASGEGGSGITWTTGTTVPSSPSVGDKWYNTNEDILYEYQTDGTNSYWIDISTADVSGDATIVSSVANNNLIINPEIRINERNTSSSTATANAYNYDRWYYDGTYLYQGIEGINLTSDTTYCISWGGSVSCSYSLNTATSSGQGSETYTGIENSGQINTGTVGSNNLWIRFDIQPEWVKLEQGSVPTPYVRRTISEELSLCYRYYERITCFTLAKGGQYDSNSWYVIFNFKQHKRAAPTMSASSTMSWPRISTTVALGTRSSALDGGWVAATSEL